MKKISPKIVGLLFAFLFVLGCDECSECEKELETVKTELEELKKKKENKPSPEIDKEYRPTQFFSSVKRNNTRKRFQLNDKQKNKFNPKDSIIQLTIPLTNKKLRIRDVRDVSSEHLNAIAVVLDGNNGIETPEKGVIGELNTLIEMKEVIDFPIGRLKETLIVHIIHDDKFHDDDLEMHIEECIKDLGQNYPRGRFICSLPPIQIITQDGDPREVPREQEGDIIPSTGG